MRNNKSTTISIRYTEEEKEFVRYMYHVEEFQAGLDGDRPNEPEDDYESEDNDYDDWKRIRNGKIIGRYL